MVAALAIATPGDDNRAMGIPASSALGDFARIAAGLDHRRPAVFIDYDGTLTPIVERPELAILDGAVREVVARLAGLCPVAIVSGRGLDDVRRRVGVGAAYYAGSHGFEIAAPDGSREDHPGGLAALPALDAVERELGAALAAVDGAQLERKRFSLAVHFRRVADDRIDEVECAVDRALAAHATLRKGHGKRVFELRPEADWDKGAAVRWLLRAWNLDGDDTLPIYLGDDVTDEDAFRVVATHGTAILVADPPRPSAATWHLRDPVETHAFLARLATELGRRSGGSRMAGDPVRPPA